jgi:UDP-N-acetylmuramate--alanine ligase
MTRLQPNSPDFRVSSRFSGMKIHMIGIGGSGMSGLARMLLDRGAVVSGSEPQPNDQTFELTRAGAKVSCDQLGELLHRGLDLVVRTAAVDDKNTEYLAARAMGLRVIKYAEMVGELMGEATGVAVAGTHGKSTTTAMISFVLRQAGLDPSFVFGAVSPQLGGGSGSGTGPHFVAEACEYAHNFLSLRPRISVICNIEADHLDCYGDLAGVMEAFKQFAQLTPPNGAIIARGDDERVGSVLAGLSCDVQTFGLSELCDWRIPSRSARNGTWQGEVIHRGSNVGRIQLQLAGEHNLMNALAAVATLRACGVPPAESTKWLREFRGIDRRMTEIGWFQGAVVVDDYAHHPTEIRVTLRALRERYHPQRLVCIFQPHQHSRTRHLLQDFAGSFRDADRVIVADIYSVRDTPEDRVAVRSEDLVAAIAGSGVFATSGGSFQSIVEEMRQNARPGDLIVTMGAGNVWEVARELCRPEAA